MARDVCSFVFFNHVGERWIWSCENTGFPRWLSVLALSIKHSKSDERCTGYKISPACGSENWSTDHLTQASPMYNDLKVQNKLSVERVERQDFYWL